MPTEKSSIYSQQLQRVQQVLGYQAHHGLPGVPQIHGLPEDQSLPVKGSNNVSEICSLNIESVSMIQKQNKNKDCLY